MLDADAFLRMIVANPDDHVPRLVFADFLEENGDPARAEFIRVQCELASGVGDPARECLLARRERELLRLHEERWVRPVGELVNREFNLCRAMMKKVRAGPDARADLSAEERMLLERYERYGATPPPALIDWQFRRGFLERVTITARAFLHHAAKLFHFAPVLCDVRLHGTHGLVGDLAACPGLGNLSALDFTACGLTDADLEALAGSPYLGRLRSLNLRGWGRITSSGVGLLVAAPGLERLESLNLRHTGVGVGGASELASSPHAARLTDLNLDNNALGDSGAQLLAGSKHLGGLVSLSLSGNVITDRGARALARSKCLARLAKLDLTHNRIGPAGAEALRERFGPGLSL